MRVRSSKSQAKHNFDPYGIYGTRSASRVEAARRRRAQQSAGLLMAGALAVGLPLANKYWPRAANLSPTNGAPLLLPPAALPAIANSNGTEALLVPTEAGRLLAVDSRTGTCRIVLATDFPLRVQPLVEGALAYLPSEDGTLLAINWRTGKLLWRATIGDSSSTRPCAIDAAVPPPVGAAVVPPVDAAQTPTVAISLSPAATPSPVTTPAHLIVAGADDGNVVAFDGANGRQVWKQTLPGGTGAGIVALPDAKRPEVLVPALGHSATSGGLWCLDAGTGKVVWRFPKAEDSAAPQLAPPAVGESADGAPMAIALDDSGAIFCVDARTGLKVWKAYARPVNAKMAGQAVMFRTEPLLMAVRGNARVYAGGNDGALRCLDASNGELLWTRSFDSPLRRSPIPITVADGAQQRQYVLVNTRTDLEVLDAQTGSPVYSLQTDGPAFCAGIDAAGRILTVGDSGDFATYELPG